MYEIFEKLCKENGVTPYKVCKETGLTTATISNWKAGRYIPKADKLKKIADYFGVTLDYLMAGNKEPEEKKIELTSRDKRDISKDLNRIMAEIRNGEDEPLYYNGVEIDEKSLILLENAIEHALIETKKENKVKFNPHKNKK